jgi:hypothetical protein
VITPNSAPMTPPHFVVNTASANTTRAWSAGWFHSI